MLKIPAIMSKDNWCFVLGAEYPGFFTTLKPLSVRSWSCISLFSSSLLFARKKNRTSGAQSRGWKDFKSLFWTSLKIIHHVISLKQILSPLATAKVQHWNVLKLWSTYAYILVDLNHSQPVIKCKCSIIVYNLSCFS